MKRKRRQRFALVKVIDPHYHRKAALQDLGETAQLVAAYGGRVDIKTIQHKVHPHPDTYIGGGKLEQLMQQVEEQQIDVVVMDDLLDAGQLFRLEKSFWEFERKVQVWDRVGIILELFESHASTKEAKLQIELARLTHTGPRIYGLGKDYLSRQAGGIGTRGIGETNIERERRIIEDRQAKIRQQLDALAKQREKRIRRRKEKGMPTISLVGYTSAGKTTLFNALTQRKKKVRQSLFTTLDSVVGRMWVQELNRAVLISDTIGFIQDLPPVLIDAFTSTLMESVMADVLLHVVDASDPAIVKKVEVVQEILDKLEVTQPVITVFNKAELLSVERAARLMERFAEMPHQFVSAKTGEGLEGLQEMVVEELTETVGVKPQRWYGA